MNLVSKWPVATDLACVAWGIATVQQIICSLSTAMNAPAFVRTAWPEYSKSLWMWRRDWVAIGEANRYALRRTSGPVYSYVS